MYECIERFVLIELNYGSFSSNNLIVVDIQYSTDRIELMFRFKIIANQIKNWLYTSKCYFFSFTKLILEFFSDRITTYSTLTSTIQQCCKTSILPSFIFIGILPFYIHPPTFSISIELYSMFWKKIQFVRTARIEDKKNRYLFFC